jgi:preprotein translocase subunit SecF
LRRLFEKFSRLYHGQTGFDFVERKKIWFLISGCVIIAGLISLGARGLNFSIDFAGGTAWQFPAHGLTVSEVRSELNKLNLSDATVEELGSSKQATILIEDKIVNRKGESILNFENSIANELAKFAKISPKEISISEVGPTWGSEITSKAVEALIIFFIAIMAFIAISFEWQMAIAAMVAVIHDILVTVGVYSLSGFQVTPDTVVAFLTILGYSLYDTMVVFDRVRDNEKAYGPSGRYSYSSLVNLSMNQVLARSINTSLVAILPILSVLVVGADILGATTLQFFGLALFIGLTTGAYSSIFIASPILSMLREREKHNKEVRERLKAKGQLVKVALRDHLEQITAKEKEAVDEISSEKELVAVGGAINSDDRQVGQDSRSASYRRKPPPRSKRKR